MSRHLLQVVLPFHFFLQLLEFQLVMNKVLHTFQSHQMHWMPTVFVATVLPLLVPQLFWLFRLLIDLVFLVLRLPFWLFL